MSGGTLIYTPGVSIVIESAIAGPIDVSADASQGSLVLRENGSHSLNFTLENALRKYDGLFTPNDRIVVQMRRFRWLQVFAGYLDTAPYFSAFARKVELSAQCPLKALKYWPWDRGSEQSQALIFEKRDTSAQDGGLSDIVIRILKEVTRWPEERIHIGRVPEEWYSKFERIYQRMNDETTTANEPFIGINPIIAGKPVGGFPPGALSPTSTVTAGSGTDAQYESLQIAPADYDVALATIKQVESGNDYKAINKGDGNGGWATGAYQFMTDSWGNYRGYANAYLAPPEIQDEKALEYLRSIVSKYGNKLLNIPWGWYYPVSLRDPSWLDKIPAANEGNKLTIRQYGYKWAGVYLGMYEKMRNGASPILSPVVQSGPPSATTSSTSSAGILYPIPAGINQVRYSEVGWGGYQNGNIPSSALAYTKNTGQGHPLAVQAWDLLCKEAEAKGLDVRGSMYRSAAQQTILHNANPNGAAPTGKSNHGWGLAIDISSLVPNASYNKKNQGVSREGMYQTAEYLWLKENAYRFGFGHPIWGQLGGDGPLEPWHWEFFAIYSYKNGDGTTASGAGVNPFSSSPGAVGSFQQPSSNQLFAVLGSWSQDPGELDLESPTLFGYRALMNDEPVFKTIDSILRASGRNYCSAPNGDLISWFPDYWGEYGLAGAVDIETVELKDFAVMWGDANMITHQFVEGAIYTTGMGPMPAGVIDALHAVETRGVVTVDMPGLLSAVLNVKDSSQYPWLTEPQLLLQRFGARIDRAKNSVILGGQQEFWAAVAKFTRAWAAQFSTTVPMTFMPELFPGMLMRIPSFKVQMYVTQVTHSWNYEEGAGFSTDVSTMAVSATDGSGFYLFPKGGDVVSRPGAGTPGPASSGLS